MSDSTFDDDLDDLRFLTMAQVCKMLNLSRTHIYRLEKAGKFPRRYKVGVWRVGYRRSDILEFMRNRPQAPLAA